MPKTVAYELGFDQNMFNLFLLRVSGFYRDIREQPRTVEFFSLGSVVNYTSRRPWNYEDVRGAEEYAQGHIPLAVNIGHVAAVLRNPNTEDLLPIARVQELLGYSINDPSFMGYVDGMHPKRLIDPGYVGRKYRDDLPPS